MTFSAAGLAAGIKPCAWICPCQTVFLDVTHVLLSQGWAELADEVTEASYVEALASAQSKKAGIWGDGPR